MQVSSSVVLPTTPRQAWDVLMDWERQADWMLDADRITVVSEAREGVGVRLAVRTRLLGIAAFTEPMEVTGWDPPRRLEIAHGSLVQGMGTWNLERVVDGTLFTWTERIRLRVPVGGELVARLYRPMMRALMVRAMEGLRRHVIAIGPAPRVASGKASEADGSSRSTVRGAGPAQ